MSFSNTIAYIWSDGSRCYVLSHEEQQKHEQFVPPNAVHTGTVALAVILDRILNKTTGIEATLDEYRNPSTRIGKL